MKYLLVFVSLLFQTITWAETTTSYDFSNRTPGTNIYAYEGISGSQIPVNNSFPSSQYSASSYSDISSNNNRYHDYINYSKNQFPSIRYVVKVNEDANAISKLNIFWNGFGVNSKRNQTDGVRIYIWNNSSNGYDFVTQNTNDWVVELEQDITSNIANYVDNSNQVTIYVVSQKKTFNRGSNWIGTDYFRLSVTYDDTPVPATAIANFQFDECAYFGVGNEVVDQFGNYSGISHNSVNTSVDAQIEKALDISSEQQHVQVNIPLPSTYSVSTWFKKPTDNSGNRFFILGAMASGGDLLYLDRDNGWRWGIYDATAGNSVDGNYSFNNLDNSWHHMALVYQNSQTKLYINGSFVEAINLAPSGTLKYIGTSFDDFGTSTPQGFRAPLDEFVVFTGALTENEILTIYNYQNNGKNYDGTSRQITQCAQLIAQYSMEESIWSNTVYDVIDETGNFTAQAVGGALTGNSIPALAGNPGTCRYGYFDGVDDYIEMPSSFENLQDSFTIAAWIKPENVNSGSRIFIDDENNQRGFGFSLGDPGNGRLRFFSRGVSPVSVDTNTSIVAGDWSFVTAVHNSVTKTRQIYINGVAQIITGGSTSNTYSGTWGIDSGPASIGGETSRSGETGSRFHFTGAIDEVHVFKGALTSAEINEVYAKTHPCAEPVIHHYEIVHDGNGLTCAAEPITIKACTNSSCSNLSTESVSLDFTVNGVTKSPVTFTGSTSSNNPSFSFNHTTPEVLTLSVAGATVPATNPVQCTGSSCDMRFSDSEFRFLYGANNDSAIASQTSGVEFSGVKIQARKDENGECKGLFSGLKSVELWQENLPTDSSDTNVGLEFQIDGNGIGKNAASARSIALNFATDSTGAESIATIPASVYLDAGKIRLRASYNQDDISLVGNSNEFWVRPDRFEINSTAQYNLSTDTYAAGKAFNFNIRALNRDGTVTQNYRQIDGELELKLVRVLPTNTASVDGFFTIAANTDLLALVEAPTNVFTRQTLTSFNLDEKGVSEFSSAKYSEVGNITVDVQDVKYGGLDDSGWVIPAIEVTLGRFIPAYFEQTLNRNISGNLDSYHSAISGCSALNWAYTGQKVLDSESKGTIHYGIEPVIDITAYNAEKKPTKNYTLAEDINSNKILMKLSNSGVTITSPVFDHKQLQVGGVVKEDKSENVAINSNMERGTLKAKPGVAGTMTYTFSELDRFSYVRNHLSFLKPFEAEIPFITEAVVDADGVTLRADNTPLDSTDNPTEDFTIMGVNIRFARMVIENTFGPETSNLRVPLNVQTYNGTSFVQANDESCLTPLINAKKMGTIYSGNLNLWDYRLFDDASSPDAIEIGDTNASIVNGFLAGEHGNLLFSASQAQGALELEYEVPAWLKFDWQNLDTDNDGPYTDNPTAILNFGIYRGNDRIISWREVTN